MIKRFVFFVMWWGAALSAPLPRIVFLTENYPPFNYRSALGQAQGTSAKLLRKIHAFLGLPPPVIHVNAWSRSYSLAQTPGKQNAVFSTARTKKRIPLFKWVGPLGSAQNAVIMVAPPEKLKVTFFSEKNLRQHRYAVVEDDVAAMMLKAQHVPPSHLLAVKKPQLMLQLVTHKRADYVAYAVPVLHYMLGKEEWKGLAMKAIYPLGKPIEYYYAFNKSVSDATIHAYQKALMCVVKGYLTPKACKRTSR